MPDGPALLAAVRADPDADLPRLVYADYLDDTGDPARAEYIRCAVEDARLTTDSPRRRELAFRCRQLLDAYWADWNDLPADRNGLERGFVCVAASNTDRLELAEVFAHPLRRLWVREPDLRIEQLERVPADNRLKALDLTGNALTADDLQSLARLHLFAHLDTLVLSLNHLNDEAASVLCGEAFFQRLRSLQVGGNLFTDIGRQRLCDHFGDRVAFVCERHPDHLYALGDDYLRTGFGADQTQVIVADSIAGVSVVRFDHAGRLLSGEATPDFSAAVDWRAEELIREPATVRMRRFSAGGLRITDYSDTLVEDWYDPFTDRGAWDIRNLAAWLADGKYVLDFGNGDDYWVDGDGEVTDT